MGRVGIGEREERVEPVLGRREGLGDLETDAPKASCADRNEKRFLRSDRAGEVFDPSRDEFGPGQTFDHKPMIRGA